MHIRTQWLNCAAVVFIISYTLYLTSGSIVSQSWSNALLPGFFLSALLLVKEKSDFGNFYVAVGLLFNAAIYTAAILLILKFLKRVRSQRSG
jgi:hypothetical protein